MCSNVGWRARTNSCLWVAPDDFKPATINPRQPAVVDVGSNSEVTVQFANKQVGTACPAHMSQPSHMRRQNPDEAVTFKGSHVECSPNDCVLMFTGEEYVLERLHSSVQSLRNVRISTRVSEHMPLRMKRCVAAMRAVPGVRVLIVLPPCMPIPGRAEARDCCTP